MGFSGDLIAQMLVCMLVFCIMVTLFPRRRHDVWLAVLAVLLFALPRAGMVIGRIDLPLPIAHILSVILILDWALFRRQRVNTRTRLNYFFLAYATVAALGLVVGLSTGGNQIVAALESFFYLFSIGLFFYARSSFANQDSFLLFMKTLLVISICVSLYGIAQKFLGSKILIDHVTYNSAGDVAKSYLESADPAMRRVLSSYGDPNVLAGQLVVFAALALAVVAGQNVSPKIRLACCFVLLVNIICLVFTRSRMGLASLLVAATIVFAWKNRWLWLALAAILLVAMVAGPNILASAVAGEFSNVIDKADVRLQFPVMIWELLRAAPFGCGFGNTVELAIRGFNWSFTIHPANIVWAGFNSFWLALFSRLGIPGLFSFTFLVVALFHYVWHQARRVVHPLGQAFLVGTLAGLLAQSIIWIANNTYMLPGGGLNFWFTIGMLVAGCHAFVPQTYPVLVPNIQPGFPPQWTPAWNISPKTQNQ